jgi:hypothetical protein
VQFFTAQTGKEKAKTEKTQQKPEKKQNLCGYAGIRKKRCR